MIGKKDEKCESVITSSIDKKYLTICLIGLMIFSAGMTLAMGSHFLKDAETYYSHTSYSSTWQSMMVGITGIMAASIGIVVGIAGFLSAGFISEGLDNKTRVSLLGSGVGLLFVLLFITLIFGLTSI